MKIVTEVTPPMKSQHAELLAALQGTAEWVGIPDVDWPEIKRIRAALTYAKKTGKIGDYESSAEQTAPDVYTLKVRRV